MKRVLLVATLALVATAGTATRGYASGAFGLFYCPSYCTSYCQACCPQNAFSSNGCLMGCCPPPAWPYTGYGGGGCGLYQPVQNGGYEHNPGCHNGGGHKGFGQKGGQGCGTHGGGCGTGPCCRMGTPHALQLVESSPQHFGPVCLHHCGMESYGLGGLRNHAPHGNGGACVGASGGNGFYNGQMSAPMVYSWEPPVAPALPTANQNTLAQYWTANMAREQAANFMQQVSYPGYYYPAAPTMPNWGYGYGYYPTNGQPMYNPAASGYQGGW